MEKAMPMRISLVVILMAGVLCAFYLNRQQLVDNPLQRIASVNYSLNAPPPDLAAMNNQTITAPIFFDEVVNALERRRKDGVDLKVALAHINDIAALRSRASHGDLIATTQLINVAEMCAGGTVDLSGKNDFSACRAALGVKNSGEMERLLVGLVGQLARAGYVNAKLEFAQRILIMIEEGRLSAAVDADADNISRSKAFLVELAEAGDAEGAFRLAQAYLKGVLFEQNSELGLRYAYLARERDPERFQNVELMLGI